MKTAERKAKYPDGYWFLVFKRSVEIMEKEKLHPDLAHNRAVQEINKELDQQSLPLT